MQAGNYSTELLLALVIAAALGSILLLVRRARRGTHPRARPVPSQAIPFLESGEENLYFPLDRLEGDGMVIGRGQQTIDFTIPETVAHADSVSKRHARIYLDSASGCVIIEDLGSTNGIYINGARAPRKNVLKDRWTIGLGSVTLTYRDGESDTGPLD